MVLLYAALFVLLYRIRLARRDDRWQKTNGKKFKQNAVLALLTYYIASNLPFRPIENDQ